MAKNDKEQKPAKNRIEVALAKGENAVDTYLTDVTVEQFIYDVKNLKYRYANKGAIESAIEALQLLLEEPKPTAESVVEEEEEELVVPAEESKEEKKEEKK